MGIQGAGRGGLAALVGQWRQRERIAFTGSCVLIASLMAASAVGVFPVILRSTGSPGNSVTAYSGAADAHGLRVALLWWPFALVLAAGYFLLISRYYRGKVRVEPETP